MDKLAIKGHRTRGSEIIELLEMLGGINWPYSKYFGNEPTLVYYINNHGYIFADEINNSSRCTIYTLEEFLEKFPYKVGDRVSSKYLKNYKIEKMEWEDTNNRVIYKLQGMGWYNASELQPYEEETMEEQKKDYEEWFQIDYLEFENNDDTWADEVEVNLGKDYEIQIRGDKTFIVKKQLQLPKTYAECCDVLSIPPYYNLRYHTYEHGYGEFTTINKLCSLQDKLNTLGKLLICRDAYWQIAGEQMGLGEPWKPNWLDTEQDKFVLYTHNNIICSNRFVLGHNVLAFPTKEMRDIFFENFNDLIESCKELL